MNDTPATHRFMRALDALRRAVATDPRPAPRDFRERLAYIERDLAEMRTRVNALFFAVLAAAIGQLISRLFT